MSKTTKKLVKETRYLGITGFSRLKKYELEKAIRNANTKEKNAGYEACETCFREQHKQRLIDEHLYTKTFLDDVFRKLSLLSENCGNDRVVIDRDVEVCGNCGQVS